MAAVKTPGAASRAGRKGGLSTARKHSKEFLSQRASRGGTTTRVRYGAEYFGYIRSLGWRRKAKTEI